MTTNYGGGMLLATVIRRFGAPIIGIAMLIVGIALITTTEPTSFGWTAYAPLPDQMSQPMSSSFQTILGSALVVVGIVIAAMWAILVWRRRTPNRNTEPPETPDAM